MKILVTGGAGFIGSNFVRLALDHDAVDEIVNLDLLTYAGNLENLADLIEDPRHRFVRGDVCDVDLASRVGPGDRRGCASRCREPRGSLGHLGGALRTHQRPGHAYPAGCFALEAGTRRFLQVSTDEVYGELPWRDPDEHDPRAPRFTETTPLAPRSPYAATKAAADLLALSYHTTHGLDVVVTRCSNNYGPYQFPEKLIPLMVTNALEGRELPVYGDGLNVRDWIHVEDHCRGVLACSWSEAWPGRVYNFGGDAERTNLQVVRAILQARRRLRRAGSSPPYATGPATTAATPSTPPAPGPSSGGPRRSTSTKGLRAHCGVVQGQPVVVAAGARPESTAAITIEMYGVGGYHGVPPVPRVTS
jgi:dTDP-glucose 4,6-dehydratase